MSWAVISTWRFGLSAVMRASEILSCNGNSLDAVEEAIKEVEADPEVDSVGLGALPNWEGEVELDAAIMDGRDLSIGGVAGLKGFLHPISVARQVMRTLPHNLLVGEGASDFAGRHGFERAILITDKARQGWEERRQEALKGKRHMTGHDTVGVIAIDANGDMACGTSTSGTAMKQKGRVGDSPLVGSGFYVDNEVGGAAATGLGEDIMKGCLSFLVVELMRQGFPPQKAAEEAITRTIRRLSAAIGSEPASLDNVPKQIGDISVIAMDRMGTWGAATNLERFEFAVATERSAPALQCVRGINPVKNPSSL